MIGVARSDWTDDDFRRHARDSIAEHIDDPDPAVVDSLCERLDLVQGDYADEATWNELRATLDRHNSLRRRVLHGDPAAHVPDGGDQAGLGRTCTGAAGSWSRSRSAATSSRRSS